MGAQQATKPNIESNSSDHHHSDRRNAQISRAREEGPKLQAMAKKAEVAQNPQDDESNRRREVIRLLRFPMWTGRAATTSP